MSEDLIPEVQTKLAPKQNDFWNKIAAAAAIGTFVFAWRINAQISVMQDHDDQHTRNEVILQATQDKHQNDINGIQLYLRDLNGRVNYIEKTQK